MNYRNILLTVLAVVLLVFLTVFMYLWSEKSKNQDKVANQTAIIAKPIKTEFGTKIPTDFPSNIPLEKNAEIKQSYSLNYVGQKQLTMVFLSTKTVKENFILYADSLKKQNWNLSKEYEGPKVSSIYGTKDSNDINVVISGSTATGSRSQVSISVLKK